MVYSADASRSSVLGILPQHTKMPVRLISPHGLHFHRFLQSMAGHIEYYTVDYDVQLWERRGWRDGDKELVALMILAVLACSIDAQQEIMSQRRPDTKPIAKKALDHLHRDARLFNQLRHGSFRSFVKKFGVDLSKVAGALDHVLFETGRLVTDQHHGDAYNLAMDEIAWLVDRFQTSGLQAFPKATSLLPIWERMSTEFKDASDQSTPNRTELAAALQELSEARQQANQHANDLAKARADVADEKQHVSALKDRIKELNVALTKKEASSDVQNRKRVQQAQSQVTRLQQELAASKDNGLKSKDGIDMTPEQVQDLQQRVDTLQKENGELDSSRTVLAEENKSLQSKLKVMRKLVESLRGEKAESEEPYLEEKRTLEAEVADLKAQLKKSQASKDKRLLDWRKMGGRITDVAALAKAKWQYVSAVAALLVVALAVFAYFALAKRPASVD
jgi:predicted nuclease with TOPRIM domain